MAVANDKQREPFFVGYFNKIPAPLVPFLAIACGMFVAGMGLLSFSLATTANDPGDGRFVWNRVEMTGIITTEPYPVLYAPDAETGEPTAFLLSGQGKRGPGVGRTLEDGMAVLAGGVLLKRGSIDMIQLAGGERGVKPANGGTGTPPEGFAPPEPVSLGRWRLTGEICDGKCYQGAMRPGRGLAHKACASLCLIGEIPAVFVSTGNVEGEEFFLLADKDGKAAPDAIYDLLALTVSLEGEVERRGNLLVFKADFDTAEVL